jgi:hypothetical protein
MFLAGRLPLAVALCALLACHPKSDPASAAASVEVAPPAPVRADATVRRISSRSQVPLHGPRVDAKPGDFLLQGPGGVAVVSASKGTLIDFGAEGGDDALVMIDEAVFVGLDEMTSVVESVSPAGSGEHAVLVRRRVLSDPPLRLWTYVTFADGALRIESVATASDQAALAVTLGEVVAWGNVPTWVEGQGFVAARASPAGDFLAREGLGVSYALATERGHVVARFAAPQPGFHEWPRTGERVESIPAQGASARRVIVMTHGTGALGDAVRALPRYREQAIDSWPLPAGTPPGAVAEVERCDGAPFARYDAARREIALPRGCWRLQLQAPGHAPGAWLAPDRMRDADPARALPVAGVLRWSVRAVDTSAATAPPNARAAEASIVPARLLVRGTGGTPDPNWGEDPSDGASLDVIHADRDGQRAIPPGRYHVTVTRGFEYTTFERDIAIQPNQTTSVDARLDRVVDTRGWIAADLHVHAVPSPDAPALLTDRVRALAASGVEVAVATDHNAVTDYSPAIRELGLGRWLASVVGDEVTTRGVPLGHFNVFPLANGSEPIVFDHVAPPSLVASARAAPPADATDGGPRVVQVNHPRMGSIGYFELLHFDPRDVAGWRARSPLDETGFDAIEVFNGDHYDHLDEVERVMRDWYALLDAGIRMTATGNSDSHKLTYHECGVPRNLVQVADDDPAGFDERAFVDAVRAGRVVVSSGPLVRLDVAGHPVGDSASAGDDEVHVTVDAPPWVDVSRVEVVKRGGETLRTWTGPFSGGVRRLDARFTTALASRDWVLAIARGERPMAFLPRAGAKPFAFTNPVWIR